MEERQAVFLSGSIQPCGSDFVAGCLSTAIIAACGNVYETACVCAKSGQGAIASLVGPCLLAGCPVTEILAIGNYATSACDEWLSTHTMTTTAGGLSNATTSATGPLSTTFSSATTSSPGDMNITSLPSVPTSAVLYMTTLSSATTSPVVAVHGLPIGAYVGIGVGVFLLVCIAVLVAFFCLRRHYQARQETSPETHELHTIANISELPDKTAAVEETHIVRTPENESEGFEFPFQTQQVSPVEADSRSVRAQTMGRMLGTETTAFDFESQKVLITPGLRDQSRGSSLAAPSSPASMQRYNTDT